MAMARVSGAALLMEPNDMAPVVKRLAISFAGSDFVDSNRLRQELEIEKPA